MFTQDNELDFLLERVFCKDLLWGLFISDVISWFGGWFPIIIDNFQRCHDFLDGGHKDESLDSTYLHQCFRQCHAPVDQDSSDSHSRMHHDTIFSLHAWLQSYTNTSVSTPQTHDFSPKQDLPSLAVLLFSSKHSNESLQTPVDHTELVRNFHMIWLCKRTSREWL